MAYGNIIKRIKYWGQLLLLPVYGLSFLCHRDKNIWLFGSGFGQRFAENPRYLYLYTRQHKADKIHAIWISHQTDIVTYLQACGQEAYYYRSLKGIWYELHAGRYIFDNYSKDISFWLSGGAVKINLWHGSGNKKTNYDNVFDRVRHPKNIGERWQTWLRRMSDEKPNHYTLATSEAMSEIFQSAFRTDAKHIIIEGYPRNDMLFAETESLIHNLLTVQEQRLLQRLQEKKTEGYTLLAYLPTFRDSEEVFFTVMDLELFNQYLIEHKRILVTKLHPKSKLKERFEEIQYSNIISADAQIDVYSFLGLIDVLITDYSSVYTDYMLLDRPVVAFQYDLALYEANTRDSYIPQDTYMPEIKAATMEELMHAVNQVLLEDTHRAARRQSRTRMFQTIDGHSSARLFEQIYKMGE